VVGKEVERLSVSSLPRMGSQRVTGISSGIGMRGVGAATVRNVPAKQGWYVLFGL
jgi:hypothetical protein